ncbi:MAG: YfhO family protein [Proteobacteria bacterium]|nr:YfhO family protein [Pseudomonadota bacterium]
MPRRAQALLYPALLLLLCTGFYWKLVLTDQYSYLDGTDMANMELPRFQFLASEIRHLRFPLWDPYQWCGQPFLAQFTGAAYPLNWIVPPLRFAAGKVSIPALHWMYVLIHFQGALFAFWLCRSLGRSTGASMLAGLVFALGAFMGNTDWPQLLNGAVWAPAIALYILRAARAERPFASAAAAGLCLGLAWLSGHHEAPIYLSAAAAAMWVWAAAQHKTSLSRIVAAGAVMFLIAGLVGSLQIVPGLEYGMLARRWAGVAEPLAWNQPVPYTVHESYALTPASLLGIVLPGLYVHGNPFVGVAALSLALLGIVLCWKREAEVKLFTGLAVAALVFAMAAGNWMHGVLYAAAPMLGKARVPARALAIFNLGVAPLAAYGLDAVRATPAAALIRRYRLALFAIAGIAFAGAAAFSLAANQLAQSVLLNSALAALGLAILFSALRAEALTPRAFAVLAAGLALWELSHVAGANMANLRVRGRESPLVRTLENDDIASFLRAQPQPARVDVNDADIESNFGDWQGIRTLKGFMAGVTSNLLEMEVYKPRIQDLLGVGFTVSRESTRPGQEEVFRGATGIRVWRNPTAFPAARIVHTAVSVPTQAHRRVLYDKPEFDLRRAAALIGPTPALAACDETGESATVKTPAAGAVLIEADLRCDGLVVLADTYFPGWSATVDGAPAKIWEVDGGLRGVTAGAGHHRIEMKYRPRSFVVGLGLTGIGVAVAAGLMLQTRLDSAKM